MIPFLQTVDLTFSYPKSPGKALQDICLEVTAGEFLVIMGESGAGKSTFCFCLDGIIPHNLTGTYLGSVFLEGKPIAGQNPCELAGTVGLVFQDFETQLIALSVEQEVAFGLENLGRPRAEMTPIIQEALLQVGLAPKKDFVPATLSGGEKQRLAIASALAMRPSLLILDEPTTDLDPLGKSEVFQIAKRLQGKMTLLVVEHETEKAVLAQRVVLFHQGKIVAQGQPSQIFSNIGLLKSLGIKPLEITEICENLGLGSYTGSVSEGLKRLQSANIQLDPVAYAKKLKAETLQKQNYGQAIVEISDLEYRYPETTTPVLKNIGLKIQRGEFIALLGQNGSGKTTLAKHLNGLIPALPGKVMIFGEDAAKAGVKRLARHVGYVFQNPDHQLFAQSVYEEVAFGPRMFGIDEVAVRESVEQALAGVGLSELKEADPLSLTKGKRQRVAVASILASQPELIILDEPTTGLDYIELQAMMELISRQNAEGRTIVMITHSMWVAAMYAHRVLVMSQGEILADGSPREIFQDRDLLEKASLEPPVSVSISLTLFGKPLLSPEEFKKLCFSPGLGDG